MCPTQLQVTPRDGLNQGHSPNCTFLSAFPTSASPERQGLLFQCLEGISEHTQSSHSLPSGLVSRCTGHSMVWDLQQVHLGDGIPAGVWMLWRAGLERRNEAELSISAALW